MSCTRLISLVCLAVAFVIAGASLASAQCSTCAAPVVAAAPQVVVAQSPVVVQSFRPTTGWYPGALLDRWRMNRWNANTTTTFVPTYTTSFAPTYATAYTAAYTPTFSPSQWGFSQTAFRPAVPLSYSVGYATTVAAAPVSTCATCCADPCGCSRAVVMQPVVDSCATCAPACSSCDGGSYVTPANYEATSTGCAGCATTPTSTYISPSSPAAAPPNESNAPPAIPPGEPTPVERTSEKPAEESVVNPKDTEPAAPAEATEGAAPNTMFQSPALFDPQDSVTQRPNVPVWTAVYHSKGATSHQVSKPISSPKVKLTAADVARDAQGWTSAGR